MLPQVTVGVEVVQGEPVGLARHVSTISLAVCVKPFSNLKFLLVQELNCNSLKEPFISHVCFFTLQGQKE